MGDHTNAAALAIAEKRLEKLGWRHNANDIGKYAAAIVIGLDQELELEEGRKLIAQRQK